jgi:hypothetical protein
MITTINRLAAARAAALFVSDVSAGARPTRSEVTVVIRNSLRTHGGSAGCAADLAAAYGDYPELAARRMRWALDIIDCLYERPAASRPPVRSRPAARDRIRTAARSHLAVA